MAAPASKLEDLKTFVVVAVFIFSFIIDLKNEDNIKILHLGFGAVVALLLTLLVILYFLITSKADNKRAIWVPTKPENDLPYNLRPASEPLNPEEFEKTTYGEYEAKLTRGHAKEIIAAFVISMVISYKFSIHIVLMMLCVKLIFNAVDSVVLQKYLLGMGKGNVYNEVFEAPTVESIAAAAALANGEEPGVVELPDDDVPELVPIINDGSLKIDVDNNDGDEDGNGGAYVSNDEDEEEEEKKKKKKKEEKAFKLSAEIEVLLKSTSCDTEETHKGIKSALCAIVDAFNTTAGDSVPPGLTPNLGEKLVNALLRLIPLSQRSSNRCELLQPTLTLLQLLQPQYKRLLLRKCLGMTLSKAMKGLLSQPDLPIKREVVLLGTEILLSIAKPTLVADHLYDYNAFCEALPVYMKEYSADYRMLIAGAKVIEACSAYITPQSVLIKSGAAEALVNGISQHPSALDVVSSHCEALGSLIVNIGRGGLVPNKAAFSRMLAMEESVSDAVSKFLTQLMLWLDRHDPSLTCLTCSESEVETLPAYTKLQEAGFAPIAMNKRQLFTAIHDTLGHWLVVCIHLTQFSSAARARFVEGGFLKPLERLFKALLSNLDVNQHIYDVYPIIERLSVVSQEAEDALARCNELITTKLGPSRVAKYRRGQLNQDYESMKDAPQKPADCETQ